jgi:hypothetical protein
MIEKFNRLPDLYQGILYIMVGVISLLYALGFIQKGITTAIIIFALLMIGIGCIKTGLYQKIMKNLSRN